MPSAHALPAPAFDQGEDPPGILDVRWLVGDHQHRIDRLHRHHAHQVGQRPSALAAKRDLECRHGTRHVAPAHRKQRIGLPRQRIDVERADETDQCLSRGRVAHHDQRVAAGIGSDTAAGLEEWLQHLGEFHGRGVAQGYRLTAAAGAQRRGTTSGRHHSVEPGGLDQRGVVGGKQRLQGRHKLIPCHRGRGMQGGGPLHRRIDREVDVQDVAENLRRDLANVGVGEIERDRT